MSRLMPRLAVLVLAAAALLLLSYGPAMAVSNGGPPRVRPYVPAHDDSVPIWVYGAGAGAVLVAMAVRRRARNRRANRDAGGGAANGRTPRG